MPVDNFRDLIAFFVVARERNFTRAAAELGLSQSALSHKIRALETKLGVRLLTRTTRSVSPTEAGERLMRTVAPRFDVISDAMTALITGKGAPSGTVRIIASEFAANAVLWPKLAALHERHPAIKIELTVDNGLPGDARQRFDAHVQFGDRFGRDQRGVRISDQIAMVIVGAPGYFLDHGEPKRPADVARHHCIRIGMGGCSDAHIWSLQSGEKAVKVRVDGPWAFNTFSHAAHAAASGYGLACLPEGVAQPYVDAGRLQRVLPQSAPTWPALHIVYEEADDDGGPLSVVVDTLRQV